MRDNDRIIELLTEQLEELKQIRKLREELPQIIRKATRKWIPIILMIIALLVAVFHSDIRNGCVNGTNRLIKQIRGSGPTNGPPQPPQPPQPPPQSFSDLMEQMENEPMTDKRFELLEEHLDLVPSNLSLSKLNEIIKLFQPHGRRVEIVRLLYLRLEANYSTEEYETFKNLFNPYRLYELKKMGLQPEKPK